MKRYYLLLVCAMMLACASLAIASDKSVAPKAKLVSGNAMITDSIVDLLDNQAEVLTLIPGGACPGHHDVRAADMRFMAEADAVFVAQWQLQQPTIREMLNALDPPADSEKMAKIQTLPGEGSLLIPENQAVFSQAVGAALMALYPAKAPAIESRLRIRLAQLHQLENDLSAQRAALRDVPVLVAGMQRDFVAWLGLNVVGSYGRTEELTPKDLMELTKAGKARHVRLVVDNLQSGPNTGMAFVQELGAAHVTLSNFPGSSVAAGDYFSLILANVAALHDAMNAGIAR